MASRGLANARKQRKMPAGEGGKRCFACLAVVPMAIGDGLKAAQLERGLQAAAAR